MSNKSTTNETSKPAKSYKKTRGEHVKDIMIAVLITGVIAFVGGMHFANKHNAEVQHAVSQAQAAVTPKVEAAATQGK